MRRFFDMPLLLVTALVFGFVGSSIIVALWGSHLNDQQIREIFFLSCLIPVIIGGVWDHADAVKNHGGG